MELSDYKKGAAVEVIAGEWRPATVTKPWTMIRGYLVAEQSSGAGDQFIDNPADIRLAAHTFAVGSALTLKAHDGAEITGTAAAMGSGFVVITLDPPAA